MVEGGNGQGGNGFNSDAFVNSLRVAMTPLFDGLRTELSGKIDGLRTELTGKLDTVIDRLDHLRDFSGEHWRDHEARIQALERRGKGGNGGDDPKS